MIAVTGATGQLGRLVINVLLKKVPAHDIIAAVRSPDKAKDLMALGVQVRQADYNQPTTLDSAFKGVDKLLLISSSEVGQRVAQHTAVINAAKRAGVKLLAYTSLLHADKSPLGLGEEHRQPRDCYVIQVCPSYYCVMAGIPKIMRQASLQPWPTVHLSVPQAMDVSLQPVVKIMLKLPPQYWFRKIKPVRFTYWLAMMPIHYPNSRQKLLANPVKQSPTKIYPRQTLNTP